MRTTSVRFALVACLAVSALGVALSGCAAPARDDSKALQGPLWKATEVRGPQGLSPVPEGQLVSAEFVPGKVSGSSGVNRFTATCQTDKGNKISIGKVASTMMAGPPAAMMLEQEYFNALIKATRFAVAKDTLKLQDEQGNVWVSYVASKPLPLTGTNWECISYNNGRGAFQSVIATININAHFNDDKTITGNAGVNNYHGTYSANSGSITIGPLVSTMMGGPEDAMQQEAAYLAALPKATTYKIEGDELMLRDAGGAAIAQYRAK